VLRQEPSPAHSRYVGDPMSIQPKVPDAMGQPRWAKTNYTTAIVTRTTMASNPGFGTLGAAQVRMAAAHRHSQKGSDRCILDAFVGIY
jgi:hypothetical protein